MHLNSFSNAPAETAAVASDPPMIMSYTFQEYLDLVRSFHGHVAPGLVMGGFMVDIARKRFPDDALFDAFCETFNCLPDAVQILTPCTLGNGWLRVFDFGRFALTLFDKYKGYGIRVFLDPSRLDGWPEIRRWFFKLAPKKEQDSSGITEEILTAATTLYRVQTVSVQRKHLEKRSIGKVGICPICGEAYPIKHGRLCRPCQGASPYITEKTDTADLYGYVGALTKVYVERSSNR